MMCQRAVRRYHPGRYNGRVVLLKAATTSPEPTLGWASLLNQLEMIETAGGHRSMLEPPYVATLAEHLERLHADAHGALA
jgi:phthiocerol/phenolphthiocerol synthesis type-I polyketide synthase D